MLVLVNTDALAIISAYQHSRLGLPCKINCVDDDDDNDDDDDERYDYDDNDDDAEPFS